MNGTFFGGISSSHLPKHSKNMEGTKIVKPGVLKLWMCLQVSWILEHKNTPWKINMEPENDGLEDDVPFQLGDF